MIVPNAPAYPTPSPSANLFHNMNTLANERAPSPDLPPRNATRLPVIQSANIRVADYTGRLKFIEKRIHNLVFIN